MPSLRERRGRFAGALPSLAEAQGDSSFDVCAWTPLCQRTPQGDVELIGKKPPASRVQSVAELDKLGSESSECLSVTEQDLRRCGGDVSLLRKCAERRKMQESCTPWQTPTANDAAGSSSLGKKMPPILPVAAEPESFAGADEFKKQLAAGLNGLQKGKKKKKIWESSYRLPGVYTVLRELHDDLPPKLPPPRKSSLPLWPPMKTGSASAASLHASGYPSRSGKGEVVEASGPGRCSSLPTLH